MTALLSPVFWIGLLVAFAAGGVGGWFKGEAHVQGLWDQDKAARIAHLAQIVVDNTAASAAADLQARSRERESAAAFAELSTRSAALRDKLDRSRVDAVVLNELRAAVRTANAKAKAAGGVPQGPAPTTGTASGTSVAVWFDQVAQLYRNCHDEVVGFQLWWDTLKW
jgi:RecA/RadA recombinase